MKTRFCQSDMAVYMIDFLDRDLYAGIKTGFNEVPFIIWTLDCKECTEQYVCSVTKCKGENTSFLTILSILLKNR